MDDLFARGQLNQDEQALVEFLSEEFHRGEQIANIQTLPGYEKLGSAVVDQMLTRFENYGWIKHQSISQVLIRPAILHIYDQLRNPPEKDYWADVVKWFKSHWWSVPAVAVVVVLPLVVTWIEMIKTVLGWIGVKR